jgi:hypothetical protein
MGLLRHTRRLPNPLAPALCPFNPRAAPSAGRSATRAARHASHGLDAACAGSTSLLLSAAGAIVVFRSSIACSTNAHAEVLRRFSTRGNSGSLTLRFAADMDGIHSAWSRPARAEQSA